MGRNSFGEVAKALASGMPRRPLLRRVGAGILGGVMASFFRRRASAADGPSAGGPLPTHFQINGVNGVQFPPSLPLPPAFSVNGGVVVNPAGQEVPLPSPPFRLNGTEVPRYPLG